MSERGVVVWFTGLPSSGKSTLADAVAGALAQTGTTALMLDGDAVRAALVPAPAYHAQARSEFYATLANLAALAAHQGLVVLVPATAHRREFRERARRLAPRFIEVHVATPLAECSRRDAKGLYQAAAGAPGTLPGAGVEYEAPATPDVVAKSGRDEEAVRRIVASVDAG